jgi:transcriptional regulator with XRE-family HTH domain
MHMGPRLIQLRSRYKLNQSELGRLCGVTKAAVSQWETGASAPEVKKLIELRSKLVFSLDWLITGEEEAIDSRPHVKPQVERRRADRRRDPGCETRRQAHRRQSDRLVIIL